MSDPAVVRNPEERILNIFCDASCYNHPEHNSIGVGFVVIDSSSPEDVQLTYFNEKFTFIRAIDTGLRGTNNQGEYQAMIQAFNFACLYKPVINGLIHRINLYSDSQVVVRQVMGMNDVHNPELQKLYDIIILLRKQLCKNTLVHINWTPREHPYMLIADAASKHGNPYFSFERGFRPLLYNQQGKYKAHKMVEVDKNMFAIEKKDELVYPNGLPDGLTGDEVREIINDSKYTCFDCEDKFECEYAFDNYNTNGDCLAIK